MKNKLIPLSERWKQIRDSNNFDEDTVTIYEKYINFTNLLLSEPYEVNGVMAKPINMFVPSDLEGNVLKKPQEPESPYNDGKCDVWIQYQIALDKFEKAQSRVLFEGFEVIRHIKKENEFYRVSNGKEEIGIHLNLYIHNRGKFVNSIQDLTKIGLILTETGDKMAKYED